MSGSEEMKLMQVGRGRDEKRGNGGGVAGKQIPIPWKGRKVVSSNMAGAICWS
jgi:hypothetical protein